MNKTVNMKLKTFLILLALVALAAWLAGCGNKGEEPIIKGGQYEGQNAIEVIGDTGYSVDSEDLKTICRYVDRLGSDGSFDEDDFLALAEKVGSDTGYDLTMRNAGDLGFIAGIAVMTYCPEFKPMLQSGTGI